MFAEVPVDCGLEVDQQVEDAALQASAGDRGEEGLDRIGLGAGGGCEMNVQRGCQGEPGAHFSCLSAA